MRPIELIETPRLTLRELALTDAKDVLEILHDKETANSGGLVPLETEGDAQWYILVGIPGGQTLAVVRKDHPEEMVGMIEIYPKDCMFGDVGEGMENAFCFGYFMKRAYRGQGYMTETVAALKDELFRDGVSRLMVGIFPENRSSIRVVEKCGFHYDCHRESYLTTEYGSLEDVVFYSLDNPNTTDIKENAAA